MGTRLLASKNPKIKIKIKIPITKNSIPDYMSFWIINNSLIKFSTERTRPCSLVNAKMATLSQSSVRNRRKITLECVV